MILKPNMMSEVLLPSRSVEVGDVLKSKINSRLVNVVSKSKDGFVACIELEDIISKERFSVGSTVLTRDFDLVVE